MKSFFNHSLKVCVLLLIVLFNFSCSKDSDLLSDYVINDEEGIAEFANLVVDDNFFVSMDNSIVLDVLSNDAFDNLNNVSIINTSSPALGAVVINDDNTLTYTPPQQSEEEAATEETQEDTFVYTAEETAEDGTVTEAEGTVTVSSSTAESRFATTGENIRFVTVNGKSTNNGLTENTAWDLVHAFKAAKPGDIVYIKAGLYADYNLIQNTNGNSANPIRFVGYQSNPGDIDPDAQKSYTLGTQTIKQLTSFSYGDSVDASKMPLLRENRSGKTGSGTGINIRGNQVQLFNLQIQFYEASLRVDGSNCILKNIITDEAGQFANDGYSGNSITNTGNNNVWKNIYVQNAGAQGFTIQGERSFFDAISVICDNSKNPMDYYYLQQESNNNLSTNIFIHRVFNLAHNGHGLVSKTPNPCFENTVDGFIIINTNVELQFPGVYNNITRNGYIVREPISNGVTDAGFRLANGSHDNVYNNIFLNNCTIKFADWNDGLAGDEANSSDNNVFNQITVMNGQSAVAFNYFGQNMFSPSADNNIFYNCTFYNVTHHFERSRANSNTKFINCIFSDIEKYDFFTGGSPGYPIDVTFTSSSFYNYEPNIPTGNNIFRDNPIFENVNSYDFSLKPNSSLKNKGIATPFLPEGNDIGAFQN